MSKINVSELSHAGNGGDPNIELYADGSTSLRSFKVESINGGQLAGFRNYLQNSGFFINQRGQNPLASSNARPYFVDRWRFCGTSESAEVSSGVVSELGTKFITITPGGGGANSGLIQGIELDAQGQRAPFIGAATYTFSFYTTTTETFKVNIASADDTAFTNESGAKIFTKGADLLEVGTAGSFKRYACSFTIDAPAASNTCLTVMIYSNTNSQWSIAAPQLEPGLVATPFEHRMGELALCQRYYEVTTGGGQVYLQSAQANSDDVARFPVYWKVTKRATPTVTVTSADTDRRNHSAENVSSNFCMFYSKGPFTQVALATLIADAEL